MARAAGVSIATVSRVLNDSPRVTEETRRRVRDTAVQLDYWPNSAARSLTTSRHHVLGVLLPDLHGSFFSEIIRGMDHGARDRGFQILISSSHADADAIVAAVRAMRGRIDGLIAMIPDRLSLEGLQGITHRFPVVLLNPHRPMEGCSVLRIANAEGAHAVVSHLLALGRRPVAILRGPADNVDAEERLNGYRAALRDAGLQPSEDLEFDGDFTESSGYAAAAAIAARRPVPAAVFAANDNMAIGLLSALREAGVEVPGDMAVAGFDDARMARYVSPPLTTVHIDAYELGRSAVKILFDALLFPKGAPCHEVLPATLVVRASCGGKNAGIEAAGPASRGGRGGTSLLAHPARSERTPRRRARKKNRESDGTISRGPVDPTRLATTGRH